MKIGVAGYGTVGKAVTHWFRLKWRMVYVNNAIIRSSRSKRFFVVIRTAIGVEKGHIKDWQFRLSISVGAWEK